MRTALAPRHREASGRFLGPCPVLHQTVNDLSTPFDVIRVINSRDVSLKLVRIERLKLLRKERGEPGPVEFGALIGKKPNQVSDLLSGRASFGEKVARSIEERAGKPARWMDQPIDAPSLTGEDAVWPLAEILTPDEWRLLPGEARKAVIQGASFVLAPYLLRLRSGKSSHSHRGSGQKAA